MTINRIRHSPDTVLDQVENRNRIWNPETLQWEVLTNEIESTDPTASYKITDLDTSGSPQYFGYVDKDGNWYIMKLTSTQALYFKGTSGYLAAWIGRAGLLYDYFYTIF